LLTLPVFRYAAVAAVLVLVAGVSFVALRNHRDSPPLLAKNEPAENHTSAVKPNVDTNGGLTNPATRTDSPSAPAVPAPAATSAPLSQTATDVREKQGEDRPADTAAPAPLAMKEPAKTVEGEKKAESTLAQNKPAYAPPPPGETQSLRGAIQPQSGGSASPPGGPRQQVQQQMDKSGADRERDMAKDARLDDFNRKSEQPVLAARRANDEKQKGGPSRNMDNIAANNRASSNEIRSETPKTESAAAEENTQTRSVGGRKFRRQGKAWVDQKFKASLPLKQISRGSDEFSSLDSGLRSIAQQLSGEIIVVWKGKAYLIK
jgi:hypothetical protein